MRVMLFEMPEAGVHYLFEAVELGPEHLAMLGEPLIHLPAQISEPLVVDQQADQNGQGRQPGGNSRNHHLSQGTHRYPFRSQQLQKHFRRAALFERPPNGSLVVLRRRRSSTASASAATTAAAATFSSRRRRRQRLLRTAMARIAGHMRFTVRELRVDVFHHRKHLPGNDLRWDFIGVKGIHVVAESALHAQSRCRIAHRPAAQLVFCKNFGVLRRPRGNDESGAASTTPATSASAARSAPSAAFSRRLLRLLFLGSEHKGKNCEYKD